ncbi:Two-component response regulatory protein BP2547 [hydrothermal vent metagenome]|uniref:Two-component response regulatory protein BP2547 n=1 Tax=hydrothermal vent metagenome TaxID=652676 RepID=A0A3B0XJ94_9ZZZZ
MRILLIEDDELLGQGVVNGLQQQHYNVEWFKAGEPALMSLKHESYDLIVLDLGLPDISGLQVLQRLRKQGLLIPVLILTAQDGVDDRIAGLDAGADDYLTKPFDLHEVYARIRALIRRAGGRAELVIEYQDIQLNPAAHTVTRASQPVDLSRREYSLLHELLENVGRVLSRHRLEDSLYGMDDDVGSNAVEVHIHHIRKKLGGQLIRTVRGVGYTIDKLSAG